MKEMSKERIESLAKRAQIFGLHQNPNLPISHQQILYAANSEKRLLRGFELTILCGRSQSDPHKLEILQAQLSSLIDQAKKHLLKKKPNITEPGGSLYPKERAEACWRDCFHFARISIYGTAAGDHNITDQKGVEALKKLYAELEVPIDGLMICLKELQNRCNEVYANKEELPEINLLNDCFDHLIKEMNPS